MSISNYKTIIIIIISLTFVQCTSPEKLQVSSEVIASGLTTVIETTLPYLIDETILHGGKPAYDTWIIINRSIIDLINPILEGHSIKIHNLKEWLSVIIPKNNIDPKAIKVTELAVNLIIAFIPADKLKNEIDSEPMAKSIINIVVQSLQAFHYAIGDTLRSYGRAFER